MIQCKRAYEAPAPDDGQRVLVDRLWPRNCRKDELNIHAWFKDVAPSSDLRKALKGGEMSFDQFRTAYRQELGAQPQHWWKLVDVARNGNLTLVYAARSITENNAVVLAEWLEDEVDKQAEMSSPACYLHEFPGH